MPTADLSTVSTGCGWGHGGGWKSGSEHEGTLCRGIQSMQRKFEQRHLRLKQVHNVLTAAITLIWGSERGDVCCSSPSSNLSCDPPSLPPAFFVQLMCVCVSLQVEQLFCLGLGSRSECLKLLETWDWNLEVASTQMLDNYGSTRQRYCTVSYYCFTGHSFPHRIYNF